MVDSVTSKMNAASIWQPYAPSLAKQAGSKEGAPASNSVASSAPSGASTGGNVFQSFSADLQSLLLQQQSVDQQGQKPSLLSLISSS